MNSKKISEDLKEYFKNLGKTQEDIATTLGVSHPYVNALLNGKAFGKKQAAKWEKLFGINAHWLLTGAGDMLVNPKNITTTITPTISQTITTNNGTAINAGGNVVVQGESDAEVIEVEAVELPLVPTAVVRQPEIPLSKWLDKYSDEAERLRLSEIISGATMVREVKEKDMCPDLKVGQYIYLEKIPREAPLKQGHIYFVDHSKLGGFFRKLYDRGETIECRTARPTLYESNIILKEDIYDIFQIVGVFSTDVIEDSEAALKDQQIATLTAQLERLMAQQDIHAKNTADALASTNEVIRQQGQLIDLLKNK